MSQRRLHPFMQTTKDLRLKSRKGVFKTAVLALVASLAISCGGKESLSAKRPEARTKSATAMDCRELAIEPLQISPAIIRIEERALPKGERDFNDVDFNLTSTAEDMDSPGCPLALGLKDSIEKQMNGLKDALSGLGINLLSGARTSGEMMDKLNDYYKKNNIWLMTWFLHATNEQTGEEAVVMCLAKPSIQKKASFSFSFLNGLISGKDVPVYMIDTEGIISNHLVPRGEGRVFFDTYKYRATTFVDGIVVAIKDKGKQIPDWAIRDIIIHEGVHYHRAISKGLGRLSREELAKKDIWSEKDELRAYSIQTMYGSDPLFALNDVLNNETTPYQFARKALQTELNDMLKTDPARYKRLGKGELRAEDLTHDELRMLAFRTYLKYFCPK